MSSEDILYGKFLSGLKTINVDIYDIDIDIKSPSVIKSQFLPYKEDSIYIWW